MPDQRRRLKLPLAAPQDPNAPKDLPETLVLPGSRAGGAAAVPLLPGVKVVESWDLAPAARSGDAPAAGAVDDEEALLALEAADGTTVFIRADKLFDDIGRVRPELLAADGSVDLAGFRDAEGASRGLGDWLWRRVSRLEVGADDVEALARDNLQDWLADKALDALAEKYGRDKVLILSGLGGKALMAAIESKLAGPPGLYRWNGGALQPEDRCPPEDPRLAGWGEAPALVFIHGTGSHTLGAFGDLRGSPEWNALAETFGDRIYGFEHPTFSASPIENALALAKTLPDGARISLVTHSRGGLVGDLLCLGGYTQDAQARVAEYRRQPRPDEVEAEEKDKTDALRSIREAVAAEEQAQLAELYAVLSKKNFVIQRYVRVAAPAAGTALLSDNLEVFLSGLLTLVRKASSWVAGAGVGWAAGLVSGGLAAPTAAKAAETAVNQGLAFLSRVVLEIARQRLAPQTVPGIEAMLPDSPLGTFLARAGRRQGVAMAVIAGDVEGSGILKRIGVMFTDWMFFDRADNDLVVDTASMYGGLARDGARTLFDQGPEVNHFHYFRNPRTRGALRSWLVTRNPADLPGWESFPPPAPAVSGARAAPPADNTRPVVIYIPGIMGSNLEVRRRKPEVAGSGDRIWLDFLDLAGGGLREIAMGTAGVCPDDVVDLAYGRLARYLEQKHRVIRHAYDWRHSNRDQGVKLAEVVEAALKAHPDQPIRILAHSMGGLVTRSMIAQRPDLWEAIVARPGGRLIMLGTPNHGSHLMVETLLGKSDTMRMLARLDLANGMQAVLDIVAGFPGALQLLPQPGFRDVGKPASRDWQNPESWTELAQFNNDFWFGRKLGGRPLGEDLAEARKFWALVSDEAEDAAAPQGRARPIAHTDRIAYVFGQAPNTPCGIQIQKDGSGQPKGIVMLGTPEGDGSVSWDSGRLDWLPPENYWLIPADHSDMVNTESHFGAIEELLASGRSTRLARPPAARGEGVAAPVRPYNPGPIPGYPTEQELVTALVGGQARRPRPTVAKTELAVSVRAADLRFIHQPVLCGHYEDDPISGAERVIDQALVDGALTQRVRLGVHAGALGTASVVLMPRGREEILRGTGRGALVVGLGEFGKLSTSDITETVRAGVLRLLLLAADCQAEKSQAAGCGEPVALRLASLLIGHNSTTYIAVEDAVAAVTLGVMLANHHFARGRGRDRPTVQVGALEFVELYQDVALTAARAVADLPRALANRVQELGVVLRPAEELAYGDGVRQRLSVSVGANYWPRLMVTDADRADDGCSPECYRLRVQSPIPPETVAQILALHGHAPSPAGAAPSVVLGGEFVGVAPPAGPRYPNRLRFLYLSERARAEAVVQQRQPGLVEKLVAAEIASTVHNPEVGIGRTLFHLLVPLDFKAAARDAGNLLLVVDGYTANLPWEMLVADGEPLVLRTRLVRQLASTRFRQSVRTAHRKTAYVIRNPATDGYFREFGGSRPVPADDRLRNLPGAEAEGDGLSNLLTGFGYQVTDAPAGSAAADVVGRLFQNPYRILIVSAHGVFQVTDRQGQTRSGVVLSDGILLTAAEVGQMEVVPEVVFLSCCNLGRTDADAGYAPNRLAYSLARELIEMGVRCVVAAGWEVDDAAAQTFSMTFFQRFVGRNDTFGQAIFEARRACHDAHRGHNTWGAYQAYGDPTFTLGDGGPNAGSDDAVLLAPVELVDWLASRRLDARNSGGSDRFAQVATQVQRRLARVPVRWVERPDVQQALGALFAEYGEAGFERARTAYLSAIAADSNSGIVPLATVEQLANLEARTAADLAEGADGRPGDLAAALARVGQAVERLTRLQEIARGAPASLPPNTERWALLGSAWKRRAEILARQGAPWKEVAADLREAAEAYAQGQGDPALPDYNPYARINRMQIEAVLGEGKVDAFADEARLCQDAARRRFGRSYDFWDAVMPLDAALALALIDGSLLKSVDGLASQYREALGQVAASPRQRNSMLRQMKIVAILLRNRGTGDLADALDNLASRVEGGVSSAGAAKSPAAGGTSGGAVKSGKPRTKGAAKKRGDSGGGAPGRRLRPPRNP